MDDIQVVETTAYGEAPAPPPRPIPVKEEQITVEPVTDFKNYTGEPVAAETTGYQTETACIGGILVASCVELAQASQNCQEDGNDCEDEDGYAVAVGCISLIVCLFYCALLYFQFTVIVEYNQYLSIFLMLWWGFGTVVLTFDDPFINTGNGYFACWGAALLSIYYCQHTVNKFQMLGDRISKAIAGDQKQKMLMLIMFLSFVEAFAALVLWDDHNYGDSEEQSDQETWAFSAGIISGGIVAIYLLLEIVKPMMLGALFVKYLSWFLVPWWMFGAGVATFDAPFPTTGNGYFCAWGAFICSCYLAYLATSQTVAI